MSRLLTNLARLPQRTARGAQRLFAPVYRLQRQADRYVPAQVAADRIAELESIPATSSSRENRLLYYLARHAPTGGCIVEIGAYKGKSAAWLVEAAEARDDRPGVVSIDPHEEYGTWDEFSATVKNYNLEARGLDVRRAPSHDVGPSWSEPIALLWIDGSHVYEDVVNDINDFVPHVVPGGWVVFDDAVDEQFGVNKALHTAMFNRDEMRFLGFLKHFAIFQRRSTSV